MIMMERTYLARTLIELKASDIEGNASLSIVRIKVILDLSSVTLDCDSKYKCKEPMDDMRRALAHVYVKEVPSNLPPSSLLFIYSFTQTTLFY